MTKVDFDNYVEDYDRLLEEQTSMFSSDASYFAQYKVDIARTQIDVDPGSILEFGCGTGRNIPFLREAFPDATIVGSDVSAKSLEVARQLNEGVGFFLEDEAPGDLDVDLVFVAGVFHHIAPDERQAALAAIYKRLRRGGSAFIFEHNPYNPVTRRIVSNCPYDADAVLLAPGELRGRLERADFREVRSAYALFVPGRLKALTGIERYLGWLPLGGQYWVHARKP